MTDAEIAAGGGAPVKVPEGERQDLQITARELGQWQGGVDQQLREMADHFRKLNGNVGTIQEDISTIKTYMATTTGGSNVTQRQQDNVRTWRMWAIGLGIAAALSVFATFTTAAVAIYLATQ